MLPPPVSRRTDMVPSNSPDRTEVSTHCHHARHQLMTFSCIDWFFFLVLDIGNTEIDSLPFKTRVAIGLLQATAVRAAGFVTVALALLAPALK